MMISQKLDRRPILGSRVAVPISDLFYAPATIQAVRNDSSGTEFLTVKLDDNNKRECLSSSVVGNGFKKISDIKLHKYQKVFTTHNGREVKGLVQEHSDDTVIISLPECDRDIIRRHQEEVRLTESRYIPRTHEQDLDYRKLASVNASPNHGKKRPVSASIEVPKASRPRKSSAEPTMDELMAAMVLSSLSSSPVFHNLSVKKDSSPHSYGSSGVGSWNQDIQMSPQRGELPHSGQGPSLPVARNASGTPERNKSVIQLAPSVGQSPSSPGDPIESDASVTLDTSMPMEEEAVDYSRTGGMVASGHSTPAPFQSGNQRVQLQVPIGSPSHAAPHLVVKQGTKLEAVKEEPNDRQEKSQLDISYQQPPIFYIPSLLPQSIHQLNRPEYAVQMQQVSTPPPPLAPADDRPYRNMSPFTFHHQMSNEIMVSSPDDNRVYIGSAPSAYYTIPIMGTSPLSSSPLTFTPVSHMRHTPSPLAASGNVITSSAGTPLQNMKLTSTSRPVPMSGYTVLKDHPYPAQTAQPINIPAAKAFSWHSASMAHSFSPKTSILQQRQQMHQAASPKMSPKTLPPGRKMRGDGKKCRKVYGMENRDMWCTACRWKKACQRFPD